jgi:hypothetical protein
MKEYFLLILFFALVASLVRETKNRGEDSILFAIWQYFSYYTVLTNILVFLWILNSVLWPSSDAAEFFNSSHVSTAITFYIVTVGGANYLIYGWQNLSFFDRIADTLVHAVTPVLTLIYWYFFSDKSTLSLSSIGYWLIYPVSYAVYTIGHGRWTKFYPYDFTNVEVLGLKKVLMSTLLLSVSLLVGGSLFILLGQAIS